MATKKKTTKKKTTRQSKNKAAQEPVKAPQRRRSPGEVKHSSAGGGFLDSNAKRDIVGVCYIVLGIVLMIFVCMPTSDAFFNGAVSTGLHYVLGIGCYILPVFIAIIGVTYIYKSGHQPLTARIAIGLVLIFVALLGFFAMFAPIQVLGNDNIDALFSDTMLVNYGGYIGSAITWAGISLMGRMVTGVLLGTLVIIGFIIIGFSLSRSIETVKIKRKASEPLSPQRHREQTSGFARVRQADDRKVDVDNIYRQMQGVGDSYNFDPNRTAVFGNSDNEYLELPKPEFLQNLYPEEFAEEEEQYTTRLDIPETIDNNTRRLVPIETASSYYEDLDDYHTPYSNFDDDSNYNASPYINPYEKEADFETPSYIQDGISENDQDDESLQYLQNDIYASDFDDDPYDDTDVFEDDSEYKDIYIDGMKTLSVKLDDYSNSIRIPTLEPVAVSEPEEETTPEPVAIEPVKKETKQEKPKRAKKQRTALSKTRSSSFRLPSMSLLQKAPKTKKRSDKELSAVAATLQKTLSDFGVAAEVVDWIAGPTVTLFEVNLPAGVRVSRVTALNDDIALALAAPGIRIFAPVPGTNYVGIEVPNEKRETVYLSDVLGNAGNGPLEIAIGKDVEGHAIVSDLAKMPHLLIGGTTGSGKSVAINAMIMSILMRATPDEVRFILVDPKRVEFTPYDGIPHLYVPVVTEPKEAASALAWGVAEMERRLKVFQGVGARNISQYNEKARKHNESLQENPASDEDEQESMMEVMPYIVIVIDELADLMMNVGKDVETSISRIAQLARAAGIHLIVATQRPSTNIVTGLIKANITNRIAFNVASSIDSRVILDSTGAENLIGLGDLLLSKPELAKPQRIQACYVSESEIESVVDFVKSQGTPEYHTEILNTNTYSIGDTNPQGGASSNLDPLIWEAAGILISSGTGSTSSLQRRLKVGYARAGRIMDQLEELGVVGPSNGSKPREVLVDEAELELIRDLEQAEN